MLVKRGYTFIDLIDSSFGDAIDTLKIIMDYDKESELMDFLEEIFGGEAEATQLNDFLWHESDYIFECLDITEE